MALGHGEPLESLCRAFLAQGAELLGRWTPPSESASGAWEAPAASDEETWQKVLQWEEPSLVLASAGPHPQLEQALRHFAQQPCHLIVCHPWGLDWSFYYELEMHARESGCVLWAWNPLLWHPGMEKIGQWLERFPGKLARVELLWQAPAQEPLAFRTALATHLGVIRTWAGPLNRVVALARADLDNPWQDLEVQLAGPDSPLVRWSGRQGPQPLWQLLLLQEQHRLAVEASDPWKQWAFQEEGPKSY